MKTKRSVIMKNEPTKFRERLRRIRMSSDRQVEIIVGLFNNTDTTIELSFLVKLLRSNPEHPYKQPRRIIRDALKDGLLCVDTIDNDSKRDVEIIMLALTDWGEDVWEELNENKKQQVKK